MLVMPSFFSGQNPLIQAPFGGAFLCPHIPFNDETLKAIFEPDSLLKGGPGSSLHCSNLAGQNEHCLCLLSPGGAVLALRIQDEQPSLPGLDN